MYMNALACTLLDYKRYYGVGGYVIVFKFVPVIIFCFQCGYSQTCDYPN